MDFKVIFRALRHRNYRLFFYGQTVSLTGTWMQAVAVSWLVYRLTDSALWLGLAGFLSQIPSFLMTPLAGVVADRYPRHRILVATQTLSMLLALALSLFVFTGVVTVAHVVAVGVLLGLVNSFDMPVRQAFTIDMVGSKEDLANAIALNSSMVNMARLVGPSVAGVLIAAWGEGVCFLLNAVSYIAVIASLLMMKLPPPGVRPPPKHVLHELREGFVYAAHSAPIRAVLLLLALVSLTGVPYQVLMPIFARDIFHGGPKVLGFLMAMAGVGALAGALYLAGRKSIVGLGRTIALAAAFFGLGVAVFSFSRVLWFSMLVMCGAGFAMMVQMAASNTVLQTISEEDKRGRVMSFYTMAFMGTAPIGSLLAGTLAYRISAPRTLLLGGICCMAGAALFMRKLPSIRKRMPAVVVGKEILPEVASGISVATGGAALPKKAAD